MVPFITGWALILIAGILPESFLIAQVSHKIAKVEYHWDAESPTIVDITASNEVTYSTLLTAPVTQGIHTLYIRFTDSLDQWGPYKTVKVLVGEQAFSRRLIKGEYYWSDAPASKTDFDFDDTTDIAQALNGIAVPSGNGLHTLYVRLQDSDGRWGPSRLARVIAGEQAFSRRLTEGEYYWSDNPSVKTPVGFDDTTNISVAVNSIAAPVGPGIHSLFIRLKDSGGRWGPSRVVKVISGEQAFSRRLTEGEYYWSSNPAVKTPIEFDDTTNISAAVSSITAPEAEGIHTLYVRMKDSRGIWGTARSVKTEVTVATGRQSIVSGSYYWAHDKNTRFTLGTFDTSCATVTINNAQGVLSSNGNDTLFVDFTDSRGFTCHSRKIPVIVDAGMAPPVIAGGEYYFNNPVNPGSGIQFGGTFGSTTAAVEEPITISATGLGLGLHTVYARFRNDRGEWSAVQSDTFRIRVKPAITISRNSISYGTVAVNDSVTQTFSIRNTGDDTLKVTGISISPSGLGYGYVSTGNQILPGSGDSIVVTVWLKPATEGAKNATLTINNNDETKAVSLSANAVLNPNPTISVSVDSLVFKGVQVGRDSTITFQVSNTGTTAFNITNITSGNSAFSVVSPSTFPLTVNIGTPRNVQVKFTPVSYVTYTGQLTIVNTSDNHPNYTLHMSGEGTSGPPSRTIAVSPDTVSFGLVTKDSVQTRIVTISNTGNSTLSVTSVTSGHAAFTVINPPSVSDPLVVRADSSKDITVRFIPVAVTDYSSTLTVQSDATNTPAVTRVIRGTGVAGPTPNIFLSTSALVFGSLKVGLKDTLMFTVTNTGNADLNVTNIQISNNAFTVLSSASFTLVPSASRDITVEFAPLSGGSYNGILTIKSNTSDAVLNLSGSGAELSVGVDPGSVNPTVAPGGSVPITIHPSAAIQWARLFYRQGGSVLYDSTGMSSAGGGNYSASIPSLYVTSKGASYYVKIGDATEIKTAPAVNPEKNPYTVYVSLTGGVSKTTAQPAGNKVNYYRMISLPIEAAQGDADSVLSNFGAADADVWRLFRWQGTTIGYIEHSDPAFENFAPGRGYWFITTKAIGLRSGRGTTVSTAGPFAVSLQNGWNMIGCPYNFSVPWDSVSKTTQIQTPYTYDENNEGKITYLASSTLDPWKGYFVKNTSANPVNIGIPAIEASGAMMKNTYAEDFVRNDRDSWRLRIRASSGLVADDDNYIGMSQDADDQFDSYDLVDAPRHPGDYIKLRIPHDDWTASPDEYGIDIRKTNPSGHVWDFEVSVKTDDRSVSMNFDGASNIPAHFDAVLLDKDLGLALNLRDRKEYVFPVGGSETTRHFRIVAGQSGFVEENNLGISTVPQRFELSQNFPNPFNPSTALKYALPVRSRVTLKIYNVLGQEVRTLLQSEMPAGNHLISWNGKNGLNQAVTSGVYICRISAVPSEGTSGQFVQSRKMILLK